MADATSKRLGLETRQQLLSRIHATVEVLKADVENDVREADGRPFNGATVADLHGKLSAAINALAGMIDMLAETISVMPDGHLNHAYNCWIRLRPAHDYQLGNPNSEQHCARCHCSCDPEGPGCGHYTGCPGC